MMTKLVIGGVPSQVINFVKLYCRLTGQDEEEYWRRTIAGDVDCLADIVGAEASEEDVRRAWFLDEAIESLRTPRGPDLRKIDEECWRLHEQERKARKK